MLQGLAQFQRALRELDPSKARGLKLRLLKTAAEPIRDRMSQLAPHEPGKPDLRDSIVVQAVRTVDDEHLGEIRLQDDESAVAIGPSKDAFYGFFQEYGVPPHGDHPGHPAQPFARPGFDERVGQAVRILEDDIAAHLRSIGSRSTTGRGL